MCSSVCLVVCLVGWLFVCLCDDRWCVCVFVWLFGGVLLCCVAVELVCYCVSVLFGLVWSCGVVWCCCVVWVCWCFGDVDVVGGFVV